MRRAVLRSAPFVVAALVACGGAASEAPLVAAPVVPAPTAVVSTDADAQAGADAEAEAEAEADAHAVAVVVAVADARAGVADAAHHWTDAEIQAAAEVIQSHMIAAFYGDDARPPDAAAGKPDARTR